MHGLVKIQICEGGLSFEAKKGSSCSHISGEDSLAITRGQRSTYDAYNSHINMLSAPQPVTRKRQGTVSPSSSDGVWLTRVCQLPVFVSHS